jgi:thiol-disulfide isomerase/thioredoxin
MTRRTWLGGAVALGAALAGWTWHAYQHRQAVPEAFWSLSLPQPAGPELGLSFFRGRPLLVNFWASWCPPCVKEMPLLDAFAREHAAIGVQVLGLAVDAPTPVRAFLERHPVGFPVVLAGMEGADWGRRLGNEGGQLPYTVLLDAQGRMIRRHLGLLDQARLREWAQTLQA